MFLGLLLQALVPVDGLDRVYGVSMEPAFLFSLLVAPHLSQHQRLEIPSLVLCFEIPPVQRAELGLVVSACPHVARCSALLGLSLVCLASARVSPHCSVPFS